jgi:energy-coupling factor transporter ATP-binding protein EcfA2
MKAWRSKSNGWLSDEPSMSDNPALRGVSAIAVAAKAAMIQTPAKRELMFFLQAMSMKPGGFHKLMADVLKAFPGRLGTSAMHSDGIKPGKVFSEKAASDIRDELASLYENDSESRLQLFANRLLSDDLEDDARERRRTYPAEVRTAEYFLDWCRRKFEEEIPQMLVRLCVDPKLEIHTDNAANQLDRANIEENCPEIGPHEFRCASVSMFRDFTGALFEFQKRYAKSIREDFILTGIAKTVFEQLDFCLKTGQTVVIEGKEGIGKSEAVQAWAEMHLGRARMVRLTSITNRSTFFRAIAEALGIGASFARTANEIQNRVEKVLQSSRIMLVIDEAHAMISGSKHVTTRPELVDWIYTALQNYRVPCALVATPQFSLLMSHAEKQTGWNSWQFKRRVKRFVQLPERQTAEDLAAVVAKLLPGASKAIIQYIVCYAGMRAHQMDGVVDVIREAKLFAEADGRTDITFEEAKRAVTLIVAPTEEAKRFVQEAPKQTRRTRLATSVQGDCKAVEQSPQLAGKTRQSETFPGIQPGSRIMDSNGTQSSDETLLTI